MLESDVAERPVAWRVENTLRSRLSEAPYPRERSEQHDLVCCDSANRAVGPIWGCRDRCFVELGELVEGNDLVESADRRRDADVVRRPSERDDDGGGGPKARAEGSAPRAQSDARRRPDECQCGHAGDQSECVQQDRQQGAILPHQTGPQRDAVRTHTQAIGVSEPGGSLGSPFQHVARTDPDFSRSEAFDAAVGR